MHYPTEAAVGVAGASPPSESGQRAPMIIGVRRQSRAVTVGRDRDGDSIIRAA